MVSEKVAATAEIRETQVRLGLGGAQPSPFLCEFGDLRCRELVRLRTDEYAAARVVLRVHRCEGRIILNGAGYVIGEV